MSYRLSELYEQQQKKNSIGRSKNSDRAIWCEIKLNACFYNILSYKGCFGRIRFGNFKETDSLR